MVGPFGFVRFLPSPVIVRVLWPSAWFPSPCSYPVHQLVAWLPATALAPLSSSLPVHQQVAWLPATAMAPSTMSSDLDFLLLLRQMAPSTMTQILIVTADGTFRPCPRPCRVHQQVACLPATSLHTLSLSLAPSSSVLVRSISRLPGYQHPHWHPPCPCPWFPVHQQPAGSQQPRCTLFALVFVSLSVLAPQSC